MPDEELATVLARLDEIEARLRALEASRTPRPVRAAPPPFVAAEIPPPAAPAFAGKALPPPERALLETRVGLTWLNRVGVLTVVLGVAFFFRYAIDKGLIGETGRVILGVLVGLGALALAEFIARRGHRIYAQGITGAGIAILYVALYSAFGFYHLLPQVAVFALMIATTAGAVALSLHYDAIAIAALGLTGGYLTPLVLQTGHDSRWALLVYAFTLSLGGIALVKRKGWRRLEPLVIAGAALDYFSWFGFWVNRTSRAGEQGAATVGVLAFYGLFWTAGSQGALIAVQVLAALGILGIWPGPAALFFNLLLATAGLAAASRRRLPHVALLSFSMFWITATLWRASIHWLISWPGIAFFTGAFLLFLGYAVREAMRERDAPAMDAPCLAILGLDGLWYFGLCYWMLNSVHHGYLGLFATALAGIHVLVAWLIWRRRAAFTTEVLLSAGVAVTFLALAVPIQFSMFRITMGWAMEGAIYTWIAARTGNRRFGAAGWAIFGLALIRLAVIDPSMYRPAVAHVLVANARLLTYVVSGVCFWLGSRWMEKKPPAFVLYVCGHVVVLWALLMETLDWAATSGDSGSVGTVAASVLFAAYGVAMVVLGVSFRSLVNRLIGLALFALVVVKLYFYDVWQLQPTFRVVAFVVLGVLLLTASFLYSRFRPMVEKLLNRNDTVVD